MRSKILSSYISAPNSGAATARYSIPATDKSDQFDVRLDHNFSTGHKIFARFSWKEQETVSPTTYEVSGPRTRKNPTRNLAVSDSWAVSPAVLNEFRFGFTTSDITSVTGLIGTQFVSDTGLRLLSTNLPAGSGSTFIDISGYSRFGEGREEPLTQKTLQFGDNVTWIAGRHTLKAGADVRHFNWTSAAVFTGADDFGVFSFKSASPAAPATRSPTSCSGCPSGPTRPRPAPTSTAPPTTTASSPRTNGGPAAA